MNAFSLQMLDGDATVKFTEVPELPEGLTSAIGHADTAKVLGVEMNRVNVTRKKGYRLCSAAARREVARRSDNPSRRVQL